MNTIDLSGSQIVANPFFSSSSWHFGQARAWLNLAKRENLPGPMYYSAIELRHGIEYLLFELLVLHSESLSQSDYERCLGSPLKMKRMLDSTETQYSRLSEFTEIVISLESHIPSTTRWDLGELFRVWGIASERLHFFGIHEETLQSQSWMVGAISRLDTEIEKIWNQINGTVGVAVLRPSEMTPVVRDIWSDFASGQIDRSQVATRLELARPASIGQKGL